MKLSEREIFKAPRREDLKCYVVDENGVKLDIIASKTTEHWWKWEVKDGVLHVEHGHTRNTRNK